LSRSLAGRPSTLGGMCDFAHRLPRKATINLARALMNGWLSRHTASRAANWRTATRASGPVNREDIWDYLPTKSTQGPFTRQRIANKVPLSPYGLGFMPPQFG